LQHPFPSAVRLLDDPFARFSRPLRAGTASFSLPFVEALMSLRSRILLRRVAAGLLPGVLGVILVGCGGDPQPAPVAHTQTSTTSAEPKTARPGDSTTVNSKPEAGTTRGVRDQARDAAAAVADPLGETVDARKAAAPHESLKKAAEQAPLSLSTAESAYTGR